MHETEVRPIHPFFEQYPALKKSENWRDIIALGEHAVGSENVSELEKSGILARLSSSYYYIGEYEKTVASAKDAHEGLMAADPENKNLLGRAEYLVSAGYRALCLKEGDVEKKETFSRASHEWIDKALLRTNDPAVNDFTKAKIYFNAGALAQDVDKNPGQAADYYDQAMKLFLSISQNRDDYNRTAIRHARTLLDSGQLNTAALRVKSLSKIIEIETRTGIQLLLLQAKIAVQKSQFSLAYQYTVQGEGLATKKDMKAEATHFLSLRLEVEKQTPESLNGEFQGGLYRRDVMDQGRR